MRGFISGSVVAYFKVPLAMRDILETGFTAQLVMSNVMIEFIMLCYCDNEKWWLMTCHVGFA